MGSLIILPLSQKLIPTLIAVFILSSAQTFFISAFLNRNAISKGFFSRSINSNAIPYLYIYKIFESEIPIPWSGNYLK